MSLFIQEINLKPAWPHQERADSMIRAAIRSGFRRPVLELPTGAGKTRISAGWVSGALGKGKRALFIVPALSLLDQTIESFENAGMRDIGVIQADNPRTNYNASIQIAVLQTLVNRRRPDVDMVIVDECHERQEQIRSVLSGPWEKMLAIGLTATPWARGMGLFWDTLVRPCTMAELTEAGILTPALIYGPAVTVDRSSLKLSGGEFTEKSSASAVSDVKLIGNVVETWKKYGGHSIGKTFMFNVNRKCAQAQMAAFIDSGIPWGYIDGNTPPELRARIFAQLRYGEIAGIASVGTLLRGVDEDVRWIIDDQPTNSEIRHRQKNGRGVRRADGKTQLIVTDHAANNAPEGLGLFYEIEHDHLDMHKPGEKGVAYEGEKRPPKPRKCSACSALIPSGRALCPNCGAPVHALGIEHAEGELVVYGTQPREKAKKREYTMAEKQEWYSGLLWLCRERGMKDGAAAHRYRDRFGVFPRNLIKVPRPPTFEVEQFDRHCRIKYAKSREKATA